MLPPEVIEDVRRCERAASRVNPASPSRRELRILLGKHDLAVAAIILEWARSRPKPEEAAE